MKLFLKGERCMTDKCAIERKGYAPGQHGQHQGGVRDLSHAGLPPDYRDPRGVAIVG